MKIAVVFPDVTSCAWSLREGMCDELGRMGHEVEVIGLVPGKVQPRKPIESDLVIVSGPEHLEKLVRTAWPFWDAFRMPKVGWLHESVEREDYGKLDVEKIKRLCGHVFCPAEQDVKFGFEWLPFGVDAFVFRPGGSVHDGSIQWFAGSYVCSKCGGTVTGGHACPETKQYPLNPYTDIDCAFIGMVYPKRKEYLERIMPFMEGIDFRVGGCLVQDIDGFNARASAELYAATLRRTKVFLNLPSLSRLTITKVYEVKACGTCYLEAGEPEETAHAVRRLLDDEGARQTLAAKDCRIALGRDHLQRRLNKILATVGVAA